MRQRSRAPRRSRSKGSIRRPTRSRARWYRREVAGVHLQAPARTDGARLMAKTPVVFHSQRIGAGSPSPSRRPEPARLPAPRRRRSDAEVRLRPGHLRRLHGARSTARRISSCLTLAESVAGRRVDDRRRPRDRRDAAPAAGSVHGELRRAVRLLHARHADGGQGAARPQPEPDARGGGRGDLGQHLPLHRLRADHRGHPRGRAKGARHDGRTSR